MGGVSRKKRRGGRHEQYGLGEVKGGVNRPEATVWGGSPSSTDQYKWPKRCNVELCREKINWTWLRASFGFKKNWKEKKCG